MSFSMSFYHCTFTKSNISTLQCHTHSYAITTLVASSSNMEKLYEYNKWNFAKRVFAQYIIMIHALQDNDLVKVLS